MVARAPAGATLGRVVPSGRAFLAAVLSVAASLPAPGRLAGQQADSGEELLAAVRSGDLERVQRLVESGAPLDVRDWGGITPLMLAAQTGDLAVVSFLLDRGADPDTRDELYHDTPLHHAFASGNEDVALLLIEHATDVNAANDMGITPLHASAHGGPETPVGAPEEYVEATYRLLERGVDPDVTMPQNRFTPLILAARRQNEVTAWMLVCYGASPEWTDHEGRTARDIAAGVGSLFLAEFLRSPSCARDAIAGLVRAERLRRRGEIAQAEGRFADAIARFSEELPLRVAALGDLHPSVAMNLGRLAEPYLRSGDLPVARRTLERAMRILEPARGADHPDLAAVRGNLAVVLETQGDYEAAQTLVEGSLAVMERVHGPYDQEVATQLDNLARLLLLQGRYRGADTVYERALDIRSSAFEPRGRGLLATTLANLAFLHTVTGDYGAADTLLHRALAIYRETRGDVHPSVALVLNRIGELRLWWQGEIGAARPPLEESLAIWERLLGPDHVEVAAARTNLALVDLAEADSARARAGLLQAAEIVDDHIREILPTLSAAEQRAFLRRQVPVQTAILLLAFRDSPELAEAYGYVIRWKGVLAASLRRQTLIARWIQGSDQEDAAAELQRVRAELAAWYPRAGEVPPEEWKRRNDELTQRKERLERELLGAAPEGDRRLVEPFEYADFRGRLPAGTAFIDVFRYGIVGLPARYAAVVGSGSSPPALRDLGPAASVDSLIVDWRSEVLTGGAGAAEWSALSEVIWLPIAEALPADVDRVWLSPDGRLARIPWSLLAESAAGTGSLMLSHVDSARELHALLTSREAAGVAGPPSVLLVGAVDFDAGSERAAPSGSEGFRREWSALPGTAAEIESIERLARGLGAGVTTLTGAAATKEEVTERMPEAQMAHLATHGFFYRESAGSYESRGGKKVLDRDADTPEAGRNPLVESGIVLAGANVRDPPTFTPGGLLTAEELLGLDLPATDLVVLSACETGRGTEITGQGVMGLRASVMAAGARSMLMSLWKVPDESTALLMEGFYRNLWERGLTKAEALRQAQAAVREHPSGRYRAPVHWAAWVLAGEAW